MIQFSISHPRAFISTYPDLTRFPDSRFYVQVDWICKLADLSLLILMLGTAKFRGSLRAGSGSYDVMAEFSKWLEAGEESIFSLETEKNLPGASYELPEAAART